MVYVPLLPRFFDFPEILGMRVPAPAMVQATTQDPLYTFKEVERSAELLSSVYQKAENADTFKFSSYEGPHKFDRTMQEDAFEWLDRWLARNPGKEQH
jgi:hypothetical protein